jgi:phage recombination protein Bet
VNTRQTNRSVTPANAPATAAQSVAISPPPKASLVRTFAQRLGVDADKLLPTLKDTAFKQPYKDGKPGAEVTDAQMMALLVVANEYGLNPFLKEIYAFPTKGGGIAPIVGVDGWIRIMNSRPEFKSQEFVYPDDSVSKDDYYVECIIERHDRTKPTVIREYLSECYRDTDPWRSHPRRMVRHKALIQCIRIAFGYGGMYDPDEAERIADAMAIDITASSATKPVTRAPRERLEHQPTSAVEQPATRAADPVEAPSNSQAEEFHSLASEPEEEMEPGSRG